LVENIRRRLGGDDHVTLVLMHVDREGRFVFAGGHLPLLILRHAGDQCELVETPGPWMGILPNLGKELCESQGQLLPGDLLVLHSDGVVEAGIKTGHAFGLDRLQECVEASREHPLDAICTRVLDQATDHNRGEQLDDMMVVLIRRTPLAAKSVAG
jgi:sigma-B regulation protein RsbU (phosphoserine phosphatase)